MGVCSTKKEKKCNKYPLEKLFPVLETNSTKSEKNTSEFYYFVQWMITFNFYKRLGDKVDCLNSKRINEDPKKDSIFKVIKAVDCLYKQDKFNGCLLTDVFLTDDKSLSVDMTRENFKLLFLSLATNNLSKLRKILLAGPPLNMRWFIWITIARLAYEKVEASLKLTSKILYEALLGMGLTDSTKESISLNQSGPTISQLFNDNFNWQTSLANVLTTLGLYDKELDMCLGLNTITANCLIVSDFNEEEAFYIVRYFYSNEYGLKLREMFLNECPRLYYYSFMIERLMETRAPNLYDYFQKSNLSNLMWIHQWIKSIYSFLNLSQCIRLWDCIIALDLDFLMPFSLGCLKYCEKAILAEQDITYESLTEIIKKQIDIEKIIKYSLNFHPSSRTQIKFDQLFFEDLLNRDHEKNEEPIDNNNNDSCSVIENNDDLYLELLNKIRVIYNKHFARDDDASSKQKSWPEEKAIKFEGINRMKEIYFRNSNEKNVNKEESKRLCFLVNKNYDEFYKEVLDEDKGRSKTIRKISSIMNVNKTKTQKVPNTRHISFIPRRGSVGDLRNNYGIGIKKEFSLVERHSENDSSDLSSDLRMNSAIKLNGTDLFNNKGEDEELKKNDNIKAETKDENDSIITPQDYDEDSFDDEDIIKVLEEKGMDSFLKENVPKKIVKVNH